MTDTSAPSESAAPALMNPEISRLSIRKLVDLKVGDRFCLDTSPHARIFTTEKVEVTDAPRKPFGVGEVQASGQGFVSDPSSLHHPALGEKFTTHVYVIQDTP